MKKLDVLAIGMVLAHAAWYTWLFVARYNNFSGGGVDSAFFIQALWKISHAQDLQMTVFNRHFFNDHFSLIWLLLVPAFKLWSHPYMLFFFIVPMVSFTGLILYFGSRPMGLSPKLRFAILISFLLHPYLQIGQANAVHADTFSLVLIMAALLTAYAGQWVFYLFALILAFLSKEDVWLYMAIFSGYLIFDRREKKWGGVTLMLAIACVVFIYQFWMPIWGKVQADHLARFAFLGEGPLQTKLLHLITHPWLPLTQVLHFEKLFSVFYLLTPPLGLWTFSGLAMLPLLAATWFKSVTNSVGMYHFWDHYALSVLPFLYFAVLLGSVRLLEILQRYWGVYYEKQRMEKALALAVILTACLLNFDRGQNPLGRKFSWANLKVSQHNLSGHKLLAQVPADASVLTIDDIAPHLAMRNFIYIFDSQNYFSEAHMPEFQTEYVLIDREMAPRSYAREAITQTDQFLSRRPEWSSVIEGNWVLYKKIPNLKS
jgi:uncharacterized membrane protein